MNQALVDFRNLLQDKMFPNLWPRAPIFLSIPPCEFGENQEGTFKTPSTLSERGWKWRICSSLNITRAGERPRVQGLSTASRSLLPINIYTSVNPDIRHAVLGNAGTINSFRV
jgi:hypothetical protein